MADAAVRVEGARELRASLKRASDGLSGPLIAAANKDAAQIVVRYAEPRVPVQTGRLKESLRALGSQRSGRAVAGRASVPYAAAVHWGRKVGNVGRPPGNRKGPNPIRRNAFLWDAAQAHEREVADAYEQMLADIVRIIERG